MNSATKAPQVRLNRGHALHTVEVVLDNPPLNLMGPEIRLGRCERSSRSWRTTTG